MQRDDLSDECLQLIIDNQAGEYVAEMLKLLEKLEKPFSVVFRSGEFSNPILDISKFARLNVRDIHISHRGQIEGKDNTCYVFNKLDIPHCPDLTNLHITASHPSSIKLTDGFVKALSKAIEKGKLPNLNHFSVTGDGMSGQLDPLFQSAWPALTHLTLHQMSIGMNSFLSFYGNILLNLEHLETFRNGLFFEYCEQPLTKLRSLRVSGEDIKQSNFVQAIQKGMFPNLTDLQILSPMRDIQVFSNDFWKLPSLCRFSYQGQSGAFVQDPDPRLTKFESLLLHKVQVSGILPSLLFQNNGLPILDRLALKDCKLCIFDVRCLVQASAEGYLPVLKHLDLSGNNQISGSKYLFDMNCKWEKLKSLNIEREIDGSLELCDDFRFMTQKVSSGCLGALEDLAFSTESSGYTEKVAKLQWSSLRRLNMS